MLYVALLIIGAFFSAILFFLVLCNIMKVKTTIYEKSLIVCTSFLLGVANYYYNNELILTILIIILMFLFALRKTRNLFNSLLFCSLSLIVIVSVQSLIVSIFFQTSGFPTSKISYEDIHYWLILITTVITTYIISKFLGGLLQKLFNSYILITTNKNEKLSIISITILSILLVVIFLFVSFLSTENAEVETLWLFNAFLLFIICALQVFQSITIKHNQDLLQNIKTYNISIENLHIEMRHFRHDTINILSSAYKFIENNDFNRWKEYFKSEVSPLYLNIRKQCYVFSQFDKIDSDVLKGFFMLKSLAAMDIGCTVSVEISENISNFGIADIDIVRMVGIIFDNAIDEGRNKKGIEIHFAVCKRDKTVTIHISNELYKNKPNICIIYQNGFSTKGNDRGVGLYDLRRLVDGYDNVFLQTYIDNNKFVQELNFEI